MSAFFNPRARFRRKNRKNALLQRLYGGTDMEVDQLRQWKPELTKFLTLFDDCFERKDTRAHLPIYVAGQLSDLPRKSVEPIAVEAGVAPRTLQEFLSQLKWDEDRMRDRLHALVASDHNGLGTIGIVDETSYVKKGDKSPGVNRQWCGAVGKKENCVVTGPAHTKGSSKNDFQVCVWLGWAT